MRKVKEVLRLRFELGLGQRQIARSCGMGLGTVHEYLERAVAAGIRLAAAGRLGRRRTGSQVVWEPVRAGRSGATAVATGLEYHPSATATTSSSEPAVGVGRIPASASRGVSLQLVLRTLSTLAAALGCGVASGTQGRGKDVRGLGGGNDSRL